MQSPIGSANPVYFLACAVCLGVLAGCAQGLTPVALADPAEPPGRSRAWEAFEQLRPDTANYEAVDGPLYAAGHAPRPPASADELTVVSYNLRYGEAISETINAFRAVPPLPDADIILLQEMDAAGTETLAAALGYNYVYYPASVAEDGDDFGNAILSRWPLVAPAKLILPGLHPLSGQQRTATRATAQVAGRDVVVYSTHIEIFTAPPELRAEQMAAVLDDVPPEAEAVLIGGDFNLITDRGVAALAAEAEERDLELMTAGLGPTLTRYGLPAAPADHILARGFERVDAGVLREVSASDHFPVWVRLR